MPSNSAINFKYRISELLHLRNSAVDFRLRPIKDTQKQTYLHSYLAGVIAAWDSYIKAIVKEYMLKVSNPLDVRYHSIYTLLKDYTEQSIKKLNTPNAENSRNFLLSSVGYDPWTDWIWTPRAYTARATRDLLNEIFHVRHSFAHGFPMPSYSWNTSSSGKTRLTLTSVDNATELLKYLVLSTDDGISNHLQNVHAIVTGW